MWHGMTSRKNCWMKRDEFTRISEWKKLKKATLSSFFQMQE
jgi:hypothetical protein